MKIAILGCGSIGSLYAARLSNDPANEILCIVKSEAHASQINRNGINIISGSGCRDISKSIRCVTTTENEQAADIVLISVKSYATQDAISKHLSLFKPDTIALTLQNGYGNHTKLLDIISPEQIVMGTTAMGVNIDADGNIILAGTGKTVIGTLAPDTEKGRTSLLTVRNLLLNAGFETEETTDADDAVLRKLLINVGINAVCALNNVENRFICENADMRKRSEMLVREAVNVLNISLDRHYDADSIWNDVLAVAKKTGQNICSMLQDVRRGRMTEISAINGAIVNIASAAGISAPENSHILDEVLNLPHS